jgi:hypothetical protein
VKFWYYLGLSNGGSNKLVYSVLYSGIVAVSMLMVTELTLRFVVGLGNPPLFNRHPEIEYLLRPGSYCQFGNRIFVNSMGMRSPEDATLPIRVGELRVLVLGDSIVNGGGTSTIKISRPTS